jgi:Putative zinc-finger
MTCRRFRKSHVAFIDGALDEPHATEMYGHLDACDSCARLDAVVRRGLLVARNLPVIRPSRDFRSEFEARLRTRVAISRSPRYGPRLAVALGVAAVLLAAGGVWAARVVEHTPSQVQALMPTQPVAGMEAKAERRITQPVVAAKFTPNTLTWPVAPGSSQVVAPSLTQVVLQTRGALR